MLSLLTQTSNIMKRNILSTVFTLCCLLPITAQSLSKTDSLQIEIAQLENALANIQTDLQEKTLQYNWEITEKYIEYEDGCFNVQLLHTYNIQCFLSIYRYLI